MESLLFNCDLVVCSNVHACVFDQKFHLHNQVFMRLLGMREINDNLHFLIITGA